MKTLTPTSIRRQRKAKGLSQAALAAAAGISHPSVISNAENGRLRLSDEQAAQIAEVLR